MNVNNNKNHDPNILPRRWIGEDSCGLVIEKKQRKHKRQRFQRINRIILLVLLIPLNPLFL
jgi:RNase P protein component